MTDYELFLQDLDRYPHKTKHVRISALNKYNIPIEQIEGQVMGGSINIDGKSAVRRNCSLTLVALLDTPITNTYWAIRNKFKLEIGLTNEINDKYPDIIWFNQGIYVINSFSKSETPNNLTISISGQDKMCLLNGALAGILPHDVDFGKIDVESSEGVWTSEPIPIYNIIKHAVNVFGQEPLENIIINDLDENGWELWEYRGDKPMYMIYQNSKIVNMSFNGNTNISDYTIDTVYTLSTIPKYYSLNTLDQDYNNEATAVQYGEDKAYVIKIEYGNTVGYHSIPLIYNTDLILSAGSKVTDVLDKIVTMLGEFEYFYDLNGRFVFQKKKTYIQELFSPINGEVIQPTLMASPYSYKFEDNHLFTAKSNQPQVNSIKNDFTVQGSRQGIDGELPIHVRYALDIKPTHYKNWKGVDYTIQDWDWREIIYQMAIDYYAHNEEYNFQAIIEQNNPECINGKTGYEQYYTDIQGYWRQLYNPEANGVVEGRSDLVADEILGITYYAKGQTNQYWTTAIHTDPTILNFWFDFLEVHPNTELGKYGVKEMGVRPMVDTKIKPKSIYYQSTPEAQFIVMPTEDKVNNEVAYAPIWIQDSMLELFSRSSQGRSGIEAINSLISTHTCCSEGLNLTSIPIYYLQPNTRIYISGEGDCTLDKIQYNLNYNGMMTLNCTKVMKYLF